MSEKYTRNPNTECLVCRKAIYKRPAQIKANNGNVFCSSQCYGKTCRKEKPCVVCRKLILASLHRKTCSRRCSNINRGGISYHVNRPKDKVKSQQALKIRLLQERGIVCERCKYSKYEILQVHHKNRDRNNNNLNNLELVCPNCHAEEHYLKQSWLSKHFESGRISLEDSQK